jgi:excisionase family DNA binding protein
VASKTYLTIGAVAKRAQLEVDTIRRLERAGKIRAARTAGGHRRFREEEVERFLKQRRAQRGRAGTKASGARLRKSPGRDQPPSRRGKNPTPRRSGGTFIDESFTEGDDPLELEDDYLDDEAEELKQLARMAPATPPPMPVPARAPTAASAPAPAPQRRDDLAGAIRVVTDMSERLFEANRLQMLKGYGLNAIPYGTPAGWRAKVVLDLERFVTPTQFPKYLSHSDAVNMIRARVQEVLKPYDDELAREKAVREAQQAAARRIESLRTHGRNYAQEETADWEWSEQNEARNEVDKALAEEVEADWKERDVEDLVDEILDQWVEEDEPDDDDGDDD